MLVGLSGGVDSSAALILLKRLGYNVYGTSLIFTPGKANRCCSEESIRRAELLCSRLGVRFFAVDVSKEFEKKIVLPFIEDYLNGLTPNPCMICNPLIKWRYLIDLADKLGISKIATGHYARIISENGNLSLCRGVDKSKDQSYFLARLDKEMLSRTIFPLGELRKSDVREMVEEFSDIISDSESQEVCFVDGGNIAEFLCSRGVEVKVGPTYDRAGNIIGTHRKAVFTIGMRHKLGVATGKRMYVVDVLPNFAGIVVDTDAFGKKLFATDIHWLITPTNSKFRAKAQIRYRHTPADCTVQLFDDGLEVVFDEPQWAITPGQFVVFYCGETVLGSARITRQAKE